MPPRPRIIVVDRVPHPGIPASDRIVPFGADDYLAGREGTTAEGAVVVNLCASYEYLSKGYYVSLVAAARGQRALPDSEQIEEIQNPFAYFRRLREEGVATIDFRVLPGRRRLLPRFILPRLRSGANGGPRRPLRARSDREGLRYEPAEARFAETTAVFGHCADARFRSACRAVFRTYAFPLLRLRFYQDDSDWRVGQIQPGCLADLGAADLRRLRKELERGAFAAFAAPEEDEPRPHRIACLFDPEDTRGASSEAALIRFERVAARLGAVLERIGRADLPRLSEYDALLIRTFTATDHYSFLFAQTAESLGIPVIDDPQSILRCSNKVFLHELFPRSGIPTPRTRIASRRTRLEELDDLGFPLVVKQPQGAFSQAVEKAKNREELKALLQRMFKESPLLIVQEYKPTPFDWRVGVLEGRLLYACRYHMAPGHWQIAQRRAGGSTRYGRVEAISRDAVPPRVRDLAVEAASLVGDGLYGVDLKEVEGEVLVIEVNDNPTLEAGDEDAVEGDRLYEAILSTLLRRVERAARTRPGS